MKSILICTIAMLCLTGCLKQPTYHYEGNATGGTATFTDVFGNVKRCETMMIGQSIMTSCH